MVSDVQHGGTVQQRPTRETTDHNTNDSNESRPAEQFCRKLGCNRLATLIWTEQATGRTLAYCAEDGVEAFNLVTRWLGEPLEVEEHRLEVEEITGVGLYGTQRGRLYRGGPGQMR